MTKMSDNESPSLLFADQGSAPSTPASGFSRIFTKSDGVYVVDDAGNVTGPFVESAAATPIVPALVQAAGHFQSASTTNAVTVTAPTLALVAIVCSRTNAPTSISQTNVTWTQRYTNSGNSQYVEVWTGAITGSAGTTVTVNFGGSTTSWAEVYEIDHAAFTSATGLATQTSSGSTNASAGPIGGTNGDYCVFAVSANGPSSAYGTINLPYVCASVTGGQGAGGVFIMQEQAALWRILSSSVAWFAAIVKIA